MARDRGAAAAVAALASSLRSFLAVLVLLLFLLVLLFLVLSQNGVADALVKLPRARVPKHKHQVEAGQQWGLQRRRRRLPRTASSATAVAVAVALSAVFRRRGGRREHARPRRQRSDEPGLGHGDGLLLHGLVEGPALVQGQGVEPVEGAEAAVGL